MQVKNFPADLRQALANRAKAQGMSISAWVTAELRDILGSPTIEEWYEERQYQPPADGPRHADIWSALSEARQEYDPDERRFEE